jgi:hypothetical protein
MGAVLNAYLAWYRVLVPLLRMGSFLMFRDALSWPFSTDLGLNCSLQFLFIDSFVVTVEFIDFCYCSLHLCS